MAKKSSAKIRMEISARLAREAKRSKKASSTIATASGSEVASLSTSAIPPPCATPPSMSTIPSLTTRSSPGPSSLQASTPQPSLSSERPTCATISSPKKRKRLLDHENVDLEYSEEHEKLVITRNQLQTPALLIRCNDCGEGVAVNAISHRWDTTLDDGCCGCATELCDAPPRNSNIRPELNVVNLSVVYQSLINNLGFAGLSRITGALGMNAFTSTVYNRYCRYLFTKNDEHFSSMREQTINGIFKVYEEEVGAFPDERGILDIKVSYNVTRMIRSSKSCIGIGFIIEVHTGLVIDLEVLSTFCLSCNTQENKMTWTAFASWKKTHHGCEKNFDGNADALETEAAVRLWRRSVKFRFRYTTLVIDGDLGIYNAVCGLNDGNGPYDTHILKEEEESINHIDKTLGRSALGGAKEGPTQDDVESLHYKVWLKCSKSNFADYSHVKFVAQTTVLERNFGYQKAFLMNKLFSPTTFSEAALKEQDEEAKISTSRVPIKKRKTQEEEECQDQQG